MLERGRSKEGLASGYFVARQGGSPKRHRGQTAAASAPENAICINQLILL
jgi:hypothetical protein